MKLASLLSVIIASLLLFSSTAIAGKWVTVKNTNCKIWSDNPNPNDSFSWSGKCAKGHASGSGTAIWYLDGQENGRYEGQMKAGKFNGKGTYTDATGDRYIGDWVDGKRTGKGTYTYATGDRYIGDFVNDKHNGRGTYTHANGERYEGDFVDGKRNGKGTYTYPRGDRYVGDFMNGKRNGKGTFTYYYGDRYEGDFVNGRTTGKGTYTCSNGRQFTGNFENERPIGFTINCGGTVTLANDPARIAGRWCNQGITGIVNCESPYDIHVSGNMFEIVMIDKWVKGGSWLLFLGTVKGDQLEGFSRPFIFGMGAHSCPPQQVPMQGRIAADGKRIEITHTHVGALYDNCTFKVAESQTWVLVKQ